MTTFPPRSTDIARFLALLHEPGDMFEVRACRRLIQKTQD